jgi:hypothetical protein
VTKYALGMLRSFAFIILLSLSCRSGGAQSSAAVSQPEAQEVEGSAPAETPSPSVLPLGLGGASDKQDTIANGTSKDRLFFALPNFLTLENAAQVVPLTSAEKFNVTARGSFDPFVYFWYAALAGMSQGENSERGYGQGAEGYGKRYGAYFADGTIENFMVSAVVPSILHQDPRYFQMGEGGFWHRTAYAVSRIFVTRTDSGHSQFNFSEIAGAAAASTLSTYLYHPAGDRTVANTMSVWGTQVGWDTVTLVVKEFWPDIRRKLHRSKGGAEPK